MVQAMVDLLQELKSLIMTDSTRMETTLRYARKNDSAVLHALEESLRSDPANQRQQRKWQIIDDLAAENHPAVPMLTFLELRRLYQGVVIYDALVHNTNPPPPLDRLDVDTVVNAVSNITPEAESAVTESKVTTPPASSPPAEPKPKQKTKKTRVKTKAKTFVQSSEKVNLLRKPRTQRYQPKRRRSRFGKLAD